MYGVFFFVFGIVLLGLQLNVSAQGKETIPFQECPVKQRIVEPIDVVFVLDDSGSMEGVTRAVDETGKGILIPKREAAKNAAKGAVDELFRLAPGSRIGIVFLNETNRNASLSSDGQVLKTTIEQLGAKGSTPMAQALELASEMLNLEDKRRDAIIFFSDGEFDTFPLNPRTLGVVRAGVAFGNEANFANVLAFASSAALAKQAPTGTDLEAMFKELLNEIVIRSCGFCPNFQNPHRMVTFLLFPSSLNRGFAAVPVLGAALLLWGGFRAMISKNALNRKQGKTVILITIVVFFALYGAWGLFNMVLGALGLVDWQGLAGWWEVACRIEPMKEGVI